MRFYQQTPDNIPFLKARCFFEVDHGRLKLALDRLRELRAQFEHDPSLVYAEALVRRDSLGQGIEARELFERAHALAVQAKLTDHHQRSSAANIAELAPSQAERRKWLEIAASAPGVPEEMRRSLGEAIQAADKYENFTAFLHHKAARRLRDGELGLSASYEQVALAVGGFSPSDEAMARRHRAQALRTLDRRDDGRRIAARESIPPDERLALQEALAELDRALAVDPYDAELWNLGAAWHVEMRDYTGALVFADKAAELRDPYPKAHINAAPALYYLGRFEEAKKRADLAIKQAIETGDESDMKMARANAAMCSQPPTKKSLTDFVPDLHAMIKAAHHSSIEEMSRFRKDVTDMPAEDPVEMEDLVARLLDEARKRRAQRAMRLVPVLAEMLSDFTAETICGVVVSAKLEMPELRLDMVCATLYLVAHCEGVARRDASRLFALLLFIPLNAGKISHYYRTMVLAPSAAATDELRSLDALMREEMARIHPELPALVGDQSAVTVDERVRADRDVLARLAGGARTRGFWGRLLHW